MGNFFFNLKKHFCFEQQDIDYFSSTGDLLQMILASRIRENLLGWITWGARLLSVSLSFCSIRGRRTMTTTKACRFYRIKIILISWKVNLQIKHAYHQFKAWKRQKQKELHEINYIYMLLSLSRRSRKRLHSRKHWEIFKSTVKWTKCLFCFFF